MKMRIRKLRDEAGLTQQQLADRIGLSRSHLSQIETEATPVNTRRLNDLARALGVTVAELFEGSYPSADAEIVALFEVMSPDDQAALLAMARRLADR